MPSFMTGKRSRRISIAAASTLAVATAVSAAAVTLSSGSASPAGPADATLLVVDRPLVAQGNAMNASPDAATAAVHFAQMRSELDAARAAAAKAAGIKAAAGKAAAGRAAAGRAAAAKAAAQQKARTAAARRPAAPSGSPQQIAQQMLGQFGWSASQFSCLQPLWQRESGWSVSASNPSSGAYGIPQALPGSQMASTGSDWQTNAATQIRWGLQYIQGRYGSPCGAWSHEGANGWY